MWEPKPASDSHERLRGKLKRGWEVAPGCGPGRLPLFIMIDDGAFAFCPISKSTRFSMVELKLKSA